MRIAGWLLLVLAAACSGDEVDHGIATCSGTIYDQCGDEHDCESMRCLVVDGVQACTQGCSDELPCPADDEGNAVPCVENACAVPAARACIPR